MTHEELTKLAEWLDKVDPYLDCRSSICVFAKTRSGMRNNGPCRCFDRPGVQAALKAYVDAARAILPALIEARAPRPQFRVELKRWGPCGRSNFDGGTEVEIYDADGKKVMSSEILDDHTAAVKLRDALNEAFSIGKST